jgi:hypothetical protein
MRSAMPAADRARRCRRHGRRRYRIADQPLGMAGFCACRALSTNFNDTPEKASRPYDKDRDGFVMGEGAGVVVLEELRARPGARRTHLCRDHRLRHVGRCLSHHLADAEDGDGAYRSMNAAMKRAGIAAADSITSTRTAPRRHSATRSNSARSSACSAMPRQKCRCPRRSRRSATCSARLARSRRSSRCWRFATTSRRRRSISTIRRSRLRSISCRMWHKKRRIDRAVELLRLRRNQRLAGDAALRRLRETGGAKRAFAIIFASVLGEIRTGSELD